jgi:hypothetical protein
MPLALNTAVPRMCLNTRPGGTLISLGTDAEAWCVAATASASRICTRMPSSTAFMMSRTAGITFLLPWAGRGRPDRPALKLVSVER